MFKHFEVKSGKNKGFYIITAGKPKDFFLFGSASWGYLDPIDYYDFYKRHGVGAGFYIWTHTRFASVEFMKSSFFEMVGMQ